MASSQLSDIVCEMEADARRSLFPGFDELDGDQRELVERLVAVRLASGLSQTAVAARMGTSQSAVARIERGDSDVRLSTLTRYAAALDRQVRFRLGDQEGPDS